MRGNYPLTRVSLHRVCLDLLAHHEATLSYRHSPNNEGFVDWDEVVPISCIHLFIDANTSPLDHISAVLHELLHVVLCNCFIGRMSDEYQEVAILAYERDLYDYIKRSPARLKKWQTLIRSKLSVPPADSPSQSQHG